MLGAAPAPGDRTDPTTLGVLADAGVLVDGSRLREPAPERPLPRGRADPRGRAARRRRPRPSVHRARSGVRIKVSGFGHPRGAALPERFADARRAAGLRTVGARRSAPPDCGVLVGVGEPDRELLDAWTRAGTPYLLVRLTEGRAVVGPFVVPGQTRLPALHRRAPHRRRPAVAAAGAQYAAAAATTAPTALPEPVDPLLAALAVAWAARDLATYVDGRPALDLVGDRHRRTRG